LFRRNNWWVENNQGISVLSGTPGAGIIIAPNVSDGTWIAPKLLLPTSRSYGTKCNYSIV
jgi:hypothetical protein